MRKENTLTSHQAENVRLRKSLDDLTESMASFCGRALASGIESFNSTLANDLRLMSLKLEQVASEVQQESNPFRDDAAQDETLSDDRQISDESSANHSSSEQSPDTIDFGLVPKIEQSDEHVPWRLIHGPVPVGQRPAVNYAPTTPKLPMEHMSRRMNAPENTNTMVPRMTSAQPGHFHTTNRPSKSQDQSLTTVTLPIPSSYSFMETTFARRLHRACLEHAFHLLTYPTMRPDAIMHIFSHVLPHIPLPALRKRIGMRIAQPVNGTLDNPDPLPIPGCMIVNGSVSRDADSDDPATRNIDGARPGETWLTVEDVQTYIESKGIQIAHHATFAEGEVVNVAPANAVELYNPPQTPVNGSFAPQRFCFAQYGPVHAGAQAEYPPYTADPFDSYSNQPPGDCYTTFQGTTAQPYPWMYPQGNVAWRRTKFVLDVARFVSGKYW